MWNRFVNGLMIFRFPEYVMSSLGQFGRNLAQSLPVFSFQKYTPRTRLIKTCSSLVKASITTMDTDG